MFGAWRTLACLIRLLISDLDFWLVVFDSQCIALLLTYWIWLQIADVASLLALFYFKYVGRQSSCLVQ